MFLDWYVDRSLMKLDGIENSWNLRSVISIEKVTKISENYDLKKKLER